MRNQTSARDTMLEKAHELVMSRGYAGTSVDMILQEAGLTKGAFFYHFKSKAALATALAIRYVQRDNNYYHSIMEEVAQLTSDPLDKMLMFLERVAENFEGKDTLPGCLFASFAYDAHGAEMAEFMDKQVLRWRRFYTNIFEEIIALYPPKLDVAPEDLADHFLATIEGGYVMSRLNQTPDRVALHVRQYIKYLELLFRAGA